MRSKSGPGGTFYHYGLCELAQRQAVLVRKDKPSDRAIKSYRAKVVMTAGCISKKYVNKIKKVLTEVQICCNIYIVVAEIQQSKALERIACRGCFEGSDKKYFKNVLDKLNKMRYYKQADSHK